MDIRGEEVLVLASDPVTLAADSLARYAVLVNANDVAASGATPRWLIATLLFPPGSTASEIIALTADIQAVCAENGISLVGGHTEITDAVSRPLVVGTMAGTAPRDRLIDKRRMRQGDRILLTKAVAVEGTGLIAREFESRLLSAGMSAAEVAECAAFLERIGILEEARIARSFAGVSAPARRHRGRAGDGGERAGRSRRPPAAPPPRPHPRLSRRRLASALSWASTPSGSSGRAAC